MRGECGRSLTPNPTLITLRELLAGHAGSADMDNGKYRGIASLYDVLFGPFSLGIAQAGLDLRPLAAGWRVLDVCCGTGIQLALHRAAGCQLFGLDASGPMLAAARRRLGEAAQLDRGDATRLPYADRQFDLVRCSLALHEMTPAVRLGVLSEARRVLRPDGRILVLDFHPGPFRGLQGRASRAVIVMVEFVAGGDHFRNQMQFIRSGGLPALAQDAGLLVESKALLSGGALAVYSLSTH